MQKLKHEPAYYETTKFKWRQRIGFGISDYACNLAYLLANTYLLFYYTNCAGLAAGAVGFMFVVTKFIDAFTDYMVGAMIDRTDTKMGRYRPWMLYGAPVLAVGMVLLFSVPTGWSAGAKLAWAYVTYVIFSFGYTMVNIPMAPIVSSLSPSATERTKISTTRTVFSNLGSLTSSLFVLPMVYFFSGSKDATGTALATGYRNTNIVLGIIVIIIMAVRRKKLSDQRYRQSCKKQILHHVPWRGIFPLPWIPFHVRSNAVLLHLHCWRCKRNVTCTYFTYLTCYPDYDPCSLP